jgi:HEAT repeat protein
VKSIVFATLLLVLTAQAETETYKELQVKAFSENQDMAVRWTSLMKMTQMKKNESVIDIKKALKSNTWYMRNAGLIALDSINPELAYDIAKKQLNDPALVVRSAAVDILIKNKNKTAEVRELLWKEMNSKKNKVKSKSLWIRPQISEYLAAHPLPQEREKFLSLVEEKDEEVRAIAEKALRKLQQD